MNPALFLWEVLEFLMKRVLLAKVAIGRHREAFVLGKYFVVT